MRDRAAPLILLLLAGPVVALADEPVRGAAAITFLAVASEVRVADVGIAAGLLPLIVVGSIVARQFHAVLDRAWLRPAVLTFATIAAGVVIVDGLW